MQKPSCDLIFEVKLSSASVPVIHHEETICKGVYCTFDLNHTIFLLDNVSDEYQLSVLASNQFNLSKLSSSSQHHTK